MKLRLRDKGSVQIVDPGKTTRHTGTKVHPGLAEHDHGSTGHIFAAMIANTFHYGDSARIADCKPLSRPAGSEELARGRAIESHVAKDDMLSTVVCCKTARPDDDLTAGK